MAPPNNQTVQAQDCLTFSPDCLTPILGNVEGGPEHHARGQRLQMMAGSIKEGSAHRDMGSWTGSHTVGWAWGLRRGRGSERSRPGLRALSWWSISKSYVDRLFVRVQAQFSGFVTFCHPFSPCLEYCLAIFTI